MAFSEKLNANPTVYTTSVARHDYAVDDLDADDGSGKERIDALEVFELIRHLNDPEHPLTLEQLNVADLSLVHVDDAASTVDVQFTPTIPHCSMATLIGLCIRVKLLRALPSRFKCTVQITPGTHASEAAVNKQLNDKERVAAALENGHLLEVVNKCIARTDRIDDILQGPLGKEFR